MANHHQRQRQIEEQPADDQNHHGADGEGQVLPDHPCGSARQAVRVRKPLHILGQQRHIGGLKRHLGPGRAHGDADIGAGQRRGVVHAVADKGDAAGGGQFANRANLVLWQHFGVSLLGLQPKSGADAQRHRPAIPGHHDDAADTTVAQGRDRPGGTGPCLVRHADGAQHGGAATQIDDRIGTIRQRLQRGVIRCGLHVLGKIGIARPNRAKRIGPFDADPWPSVHIGHLRRIKPAAGDLTADRGGDMMLRMRLQPRQQRQEPGLVAIQRDDFRHLGAAGGQGAGLVEGEDIDLGQRLQRAAALEQNTAPRRRRKGRQDRGGDGNDDGAGAGGDQQRGGAVKRQFPVAAQPPERGKGDHRTRQHRDRVALSEPFAEPFGGRAGGLCLGYQPDHAGDGAVADAARNLDLQHAVQIDRGLEHLRTGLFRHRHGFAGDIGLVDAAPPSGDHAIAGHPGPGAQHHHFADAQRLGGNFLDSAVGGLAQGGLGAQRHQGLDGAAGAAKRAFLQRGRDAEQRQQYRTLERGADDCGGDCRDDHQQVDVKHARAPQFRQRAPAGGQAASQIDQHQSRQLQSDESSAWQPPAGRRHCHAEHGDERKGQ